MTILELDLEVLQHGMLASMFFDGATAVIIRCREAMQRMWATMMDGSEEALPWEVNLADLARNYHGSGNITTTLGDMFYMQPGAHGYFARKFEIRRDAEGIPRGTNPAGFWQQQGGEYRIATATLSDCCTLADKIAEALTPSGQAISPYRVAVHRLKYHSTVADYERLAGVMANSLGRWGRMGIRVDAHRQTLARPLRRRGVSDALGWMLALQLLRRPASILNRAVAAHDRQHDISSSQWLVEGPHFDDRMFTALSGDRHNVHTQVFYDGSWHNLPVSRGTIAVLPGKRAERRWGVPATCHRVVLEQRDHPALAETRTTNSTILIGAV